MKSLGYQNRDAQCTCGDLFIDLHGTNLTLRLNTVMTVPIYTVALVVTLVMGWNADRTNQKAYHIMAATVLGAVSFIICATVKTNAVR